MAKLAINRSLIKQAVVAAEANRRQSTSHVKTRGEVRGGGKKPWKQKGTGRARAGTNRSPIWVGGGVVFGPSKIRHHKQGLPAKMARLALGQLLMLLQENKQLVIVESLALQDAKTKEAVRLIKEFQKNNKPVTLITAEIQPELVLAVRNIPNVLVTPNNQLSLLHLTHGGTVVMENAAAQLRGLIKNVPSKEKKETKAKEVKQ